MKAKYIGDPSEGAKPTVPDEFTAYGVTFEKGKFADVPDKLAAKFEGNSHFETKGSAPDPEPEPVKVVAPVAPVVTSSVDDKK